MSLTIKKAQVLIISVFAIIFTAAVVFALFFPILANLRSLRETTDIYQALANAEAGIELEILNQRMSTATNLCSQINNSFWQDQGCVQGTLGSGFQGCSYSEAPGSAKRELIKGMIHSKITVTTSTNKLRIDSEGLKGGLSRTLFLNMECQ